MFEGTLKILAQQLGKVQASSTIAPQIYSAALNMCSVTRIKDNQKILDPLSGSDICDTYDCPELCDSRDRSSL